MNKRRILICVALMLILTLTLYGCTPTPNTADTIGTEEQETQTQTAQVQTQSAEEQTQSPEEQTETPEEQAPDSNTDTLELPEEYSSWEEMIELPALVQGTVVGATYAEKDGTTPLAYRVYLEGVSQQTLDQWYSDMAASGYEACAIDDETCASEFQNELEAWQGDAYNHTEEHYEWLGPKEQNVTRYFTSSDSWSEAIYNTETGFMIITKVV